MEKKIKYLEVKALDFNRFGMVLLAVSAFLFIGILVPNDGKSLHQTMALIMGDLLLLIASFYFFQRSVTLKEKIIELQEK